MLHSTSRFTLAKAPRRKYLACYGLAIIDEGRFLEPFIMALIEAFPETDGDIAIWMFDPADEPRLVALLRPGPIGTTVTYLCETPAVVA